MGKEIREGSLPGWFYAIIAEETLVVPCMWQLPMMALGIAAGRPEGKQSPHFPSFMFVYVHMHTYAHTRSLPSLRGTSSAGLCPSRMSTGNRSHRVDVEEQRGRWCLSSLIAQPMLLNSSCAFHLDCPQPPAIFFLDIKTQFKFHCPCQRYCKIQRIGIIWPYSPFCSWYLAPSLTYNRCSINTNPVFSNSIFLKR